MVEKADPGPQVTPRRPKGSGSKAPWIVLAILVVAGIALLASILIAVLLLRSTGG